MNILMVDHLSIYVQGMETGLKRINPNIGIRSSDNKDEILCILEENDISIILLDGEITFAIELMDQLSSEYPSIPIVVMLSEIRKATLRHYLQHKAFAVITKDSSLEAISLVLKSVSAGIVCLPDNSLLMEDSNKHHPIEKLSERQQEILQLIAAGNSNKQISRHLNISAGTVKAHLETIYRRLNVNNRTQAAMMLNNR